VRRRIHVPSTSDAPEFRHLEVIDRRQNDFVVDGNVVWTTKLPLPRYVVEGSVVIRDRGDGDVDLETS
jgi:hypothetical protein